MSSAIPEGGPAHLFNKSLLLNQHRHDELSLLCCQGDELPKTLIVLL